MSDLFSPAMDRIAEMFDLQPLLKRQRQLAEAIVICEELAIRCDDVLGQRALMGAADYLIDQYEDRDDD